MLQDALLKTIVQMRGSTISPISIERKDPSHETLKYGTRESMRFYLSKAEKVYFTPREKQIAEALLKQNYSYKHIALALSISPRTVEFYLKSIREKLSLNTKKELRSYLIQLRKRGEL